MPEDCTNWYGTPATSASATCWWHRPPDAGGRGISLAVREGGAAADMTGATLYLAWKNKVTGATITIADKNMVVAYGNRHRSGTAPSVEPRP